MARAPKDSKKPKLSPEAKPTPRRPAAPADRRSTKAAAPVASAPLPPPAPAPARARKRASVRGGGVTAARAEPAVVAPPESALGAVADIPVAAGPQRAPVPMAPAFDAQAFDRWAEQALKGDAASERGRSASSRAGGGSAGLDVSVLKKDKAVLEVHFTDGSVYYTAPAEFVREHAEPGAARRGTGEAQQIVLPFDLGATRGSRSAGRAASRSSVERYAVSELLPATPLDSLFDVAETFRQVGGRWASRWLGGIGSKASIPVAAKLCAAHENASLHASLGTRGGVLLHWGANGWAPLVELPPRPARLLLMLHGTASSTAGSFGRLWATDSGELPNDFKKLTESHTLLAWDHRSLTCSPIDNTIALIDALLAALPADRPVDVMSHSRGGLVGELFALRTAPGLEGLREAFALHFGADAQGETHPDHGRIDELFNRLAAAATRCLSGSFVRIACPARGTLLADGRTDLFLSMMLRAVTMAVGAATGGIGAVVVDRLTALVKGLVAERADAKTLPGIEAMIPGSPLTLALAHCPAEPTDRLRVVAGDAAARGFGGLFTLVADVFYGWHDHDYVVHTKSMFGGLKRRDALSLRWENPAVSHFAYFTAGNPSRRALLGALAGRDDDFSSMVEDERQTRGVRGLKEALKSDPLARHGFVRWQEQCKDPGLARRPVLVLLAGIMGSELGRVDDADGRVWLSVGAMLGGHLEQLELSVVGDSLAQAEAAGMKPVLAPGLRASGLLALSYERLLVKASERYNVLSFPFDWRQPIAHSGRLLAEQLAAVVATLGESGVPVHVVGHSMGGLVARHALYIDAGGQALWQQLKRRHSRLLMLGTPNKGAYAPAQLLSGQHSLAQVLGLLARNVSGTSLARYGAGFPGLMQMLPQAPDPHFGNLFELSAWDRIAVADRDIQSPHRGVLELAKRYVESTEFTGSFDALCQDPHALYVAGVGETPLRMQPTANPWQDVFGEAGGGPAAHGVEFMAGEGGDGTVPWSSRLPDRTWYADCDHATLPDHPDSFAAYFELLESGDTLKLPRAQPQARSADGGVAEPRALRALRPPLQGALLPSTDEELAAFVRQHGGDDAALAPTPEPIEVFVVHGGLDFARYPLMLGQYLNDPLSGAARRVDEKLEGQLQKLLDWKLFVGASRTAHYLRPNSYSKDEHPYRGAIVLGLGGVSELTPGSLAETVTRGVLRYAFEHIHRDPYAPPANEPVDLRLSSVLVGTQIQAVSTRDALGGILLGVWRAAQLLLQMCGEREVRIRELEIIEIDEHTALDAAYEMRRLMQRDEWQERLHWRHQVLETREGALHGYRLRGTTSTWQRLVVRQNDQGGLDFALIGDRARVESTQVYSDVASLSRFIDRISDDRPAPGDRMAGALDPALGRVLFQMLLPLDLRSRLANLDNTVLVVDEKTARYPWELLTPPAASASDDEPQQPFVVHAGLVRQRVTEEFRPMPPTVSGHHALIIGAPGTTGWKDEQGRPLKFNDLPGARAEAHAVERKLKGDGRRPWQVTSVISKPPSASAAAGPQSRREALSFEQARVALLEKPYRLLHLCGHGVVDQWIRRIGHDTELRTLRKTGMVLSDQELLGAADVEQMSPAPEFVFINCCYSGRDSDIVTVDGPPRTRQDAVLASSLAFQFIKMGTRCVVAAGWQVDDAAALHFADVFYGQLLGGTAFGEAVQCARIAVYEEHGDRNNTWGAYQCYGDPSWRLIEGGGPGESDGGTARLRDAELCMSAGELAARIAQVAAVAGDKPRAAVLEQLDRLIALVGKNDARKAWLGDSSVRASLGIAYRELGDHGNAAKYLQHGARTAYSQVQIGQLDLLVNSLAREGSAKAHDAAVQLLKLLNQIGDDDVARWPLDAEKSGEPTAASERLCLLGGAHLRQAATLFGAMSAAAGALNPLPAVVGALVDATRNFAEGYRKKCEEGDKLDRQSYALANAMLGASLTAVLGESVDVGAGALESQGPAPTAKERAWWLGQASRLIKQLEDADDHGTFWRHATLLELVMARGLFARTHGGDGLEQSKKDIERVEQLIEAVQVRWPSPIQLDSLRHRFDLILAAAVTQAPRDPTMQGLAHTLIKLATKALEKLKPRYGQPN